MRWRAVRVHDVDLGVVVVRDPGAVRRPDRAGVEAPCPRQPSLPASVDADHVDLVATEVGARRREVGERDRLPVRRPRRERVLGEALRQLAAARCRRRSSRRRPSCRPGARTKAIRRPSGDQDGVEVFTWYRTASGGPCRIACRPSACARTAPGHEQRQGAGGEDQRPREHLVRDTPRHERGWQRTPERRRLRSTESRPGRDRAARRRGLGRDGRRAVGGDARRHHRGWRAAPSAATSPTRRACARCSSRQRPPTARVDLVFNAAAAYGGDRSGPFGGGPIAGAPPEAFDSWAAAPARSAFAFLSATGAFLLEQGTPATVIQATGGSSRRAAAGRGLWAAGRVRRQGDHPGGRARATRARHSRCAADHRRRHSADRRHRPRARRSRRSARARRRGALPRGAGSPCRDARAAGHPAR